MLIAIFEKKQETVKKWKYTLADTAVKKQYVGKYVTGEKNKGMLKNKARRTSDVMVLKCEEKYVNDEKTGRTERKTKEITKKRRKGTRAYIENYVTNQKANSVRRRWRRRKQVMVKRRDVQSINDEKLRKGIGVALRRSRPPWR